MATKKKTTVSESGAAAQQENVTINVNEGPKAMIEELFPIDELYNMKFIGKNGEILKVRRAFRPIGKLEIIKVG